MPDDPISAGEPAAGWRGTVGLVVAIAIIVVCVAVGLLALVLLASAVT